MVAVLAGCGGAGLATMSGTVTGLTQGTAVTLQINGAETLVVGSNGAFQFRDQLNANKTYDVVIVGQPLNGNCTVGNGSGHVDSNGKDVNNITVVCVPAVSVGGTIIGLPAGLSVTLNDGIDTTAFSANGAFAFPTQLPSGTGYNVTVTTQPTGHTCIVANPSGTVGAVDVTNVVVSCS
jgi:hypothetical protein